MGHILGEKGHILGEMSHILGEIRQSFTGKYVKGFRENASKF